MSGLSRNALAYKMLDYGHDRVHAGRMYYWGKYALAFTGSEVWDVLINTGDDDPHMHIMVDAAGPVLLSLYEGATAVTGSGGTLKRAIPMNRKNVIAADTLFYTGQSLAATGSELTSILLTGLTGGGVGTTARASAGGEARHESEWILATNTGYLVRLFNTGGGVVSANIAFEFYED